MPSPAQIAANQYNAKHSTGPRTEEGKARVAANPIVHGLARAKIFLPGEAPEEFTRMQQQFAEKYGCENEADSALIDQATLAWWKIRRVNEWQTEIMLACSTGIDMPAPLAKMFGETPEAALKTLHRYEVAANSIFNRAANQLRILQKQRETSLVAQQKYRTRAATEAINQYVFGPMPGYAKTMEKYNEAQNGANPFSTVPNQPPPPAASPEPLNMR